MKKNNISYLTLILLISTIFPLSLFGADEMPIEVSYAFFYKTDNNGYITINPDNSLSRNKHGDRFKLYVNPTTECYVYLFYHDEKKNTEQIYQTNPGDSVNAPLYFPPGPPDSQPENVYWLTLDSRTGVETFYLVISKAPLLELTTSDNDRKSIGIRALESVYNTYIEKKEADLNYFTNTVPDITITSGNIRSGAFQKLNILVNNFYVQKIKISH